MLIKVILGFLLFCEKIFAKEKMWKFLCSGVSLNYELRSNFRRPSPSLSVNGSSLGWAGEAIVREQGFESPLLACIAGVKNSGGMQQMLKL